MPNVVVPIEPNLIMSTKKTAEKSKGNVKYDLHYALKPFAPFYLAFGLLKLTSNGKKYKQTNAVVKIYSFVLSFLLSAWVVYVVIERYQKNVNRHGNESALLDLLSFVPPLLTGVITIVVSASIGPEMIVKYFENLNVIDGSLCVLKKAMYRRLRVKHALIQIFFMLLTIAGYVNDTVSKFRSSTTLWYTTTLILDLLCIEFIVYVSTLKIRLKMVNEKLKSFYEQMLNESVLISMSRISSIYRSSMSLFGQSEKAKLPVSSDNDTITILTHIYEKIADNTYILNSFYGLPILMYAASTFSIIIITINNFITWQKSTDYQQNLAVTTICIWTCRCIFFTIVSIYYCETLQGERAKTSATIEKISTQVKLEEREQKLLNRFSIVINCRHMRITACNFFPYDFSYLHSLASAIIGYTIILIQESPSSKVNRSDNTTKTD
ncbi:gustatory receptor 22a [Arctopsyche grandis]|uniref:gustatory receptor 22a n=1 Tax=Arctopsyche grandis TaxID=121162 RepID=UPI00406D8BEA